jgi:hypothetical protein
VHGFFQELFNFRALFYQKFGYFTININALQFLRRLYLTPFSIKKSRYWWSTSFSVQTILEMASFPEDEMKATGERASVS